MENIQIISNGRYPPNKKISNKEIAKKTEVTEAYIEKVTGIIDRYYAIEESIEEMAVEAAKEAILKAEIEMKKVGAIFVATTSTTTLMPGISFQVQKELQIENCICMDILAGCSGYINAFDIARSYIALGKIEYALIIGVDLLSNWIDSNDVGTSILLSDGAGATIIGKTQTEKKYVCDMVSNGNDGDLLTCRFQEKIFMNGKRIYKYAVTETINSIYRVLEKANLSLEDISYIVPHQSNKRILDAMVERLKVPKEKMYTNIQQVGNTFCASIPIALYELEEKLKEEEYILLLGYGGGLNTGCILLQR